MTLFCSTCGAENGTRTRDPNLGKVVLYQLSYFRIFPSEFCRSKRHFSKCECKGNAFFLNWQTFRQFFFKKIYSFLIFALRHYPTPYLYIRRCQRLGPQTAQAPLHPRPPVECHQCQRPNGWHRVQSTQIEIRLIDFTNRRLRFAWNPPILTWASNMRIMSCFVNIWLSETYKISTFSDKKKHPEK